MTAPFSSRLRLATALGVLLVVTPPVSAESLPELVTETARLYQSGDLDGAAAAARKAIDIADDAPSPALGQALNYLGMALYAQNRLAEVEPHYLRALAILESLPDGENEAMAAVINNLAALYRAQSRWAEAEPLYRRALAIRERIGGPEHPDTAQSLHNLAGLLRSLARYEESERLFRRALAIREKIYGLENGQTANTINSLASLLEETGQLREAETLYRRAIAINEKAHGPDRPETGIALNNLAGLLETRGNYIEAETHYRRALAIMEKSLGREHRFTINSINNLAALHVLQARFEEAPPMLRTAASLYEKLLGPDHPDTAQGLNNLAKALQDQGQYGEATSLYRRALAILEQSFGPDHPSTALALGNLATVLLQTGDVSDAEALYKRALTINEAALGAGHWRISTDLNNLAALLKGQRRFKDAEPLYRRALALRENAFGADHPAIAGSLSNLSALYQAQDRHADALPLAERAVDIWMKASSPHHPDTNQGLNNLAVVQAALGRHDEALALHMQVLANTEKALGSNHPRVAESLSNIASIHYDAGRFAESVLFLDRALAIQEKAIGPDHPSLIIVLVNLGRAHLAQNQLAEARAFFERATHGIEIQSARGQGSVSARSGAKNGFSRHADAFSALAKTYFRLASENPKERAGLMDKAFMAAQRAQDSAAAAALSQMAIRQARGEGALATLVRERQDLVAEWQAVDDSLVFQISRAPAKRNMANESALRARQSSIDSRMAEIDDTLAKAFPDFADLARPQPLTLSQVQATLGEDDLLLFYLDTGPAGGLASETMLWAVPKQGEARWLSLAMSPREIAKTVRDLRELLGVGGGNRGVEIVDDGEPAERHFDLDLAHRLHGAVLAPVAPLAKGKSLLIVQSGSLSSLPFQLLVSSLPEAGSADPYREARWLIRDHALTTLPSVASLRSSHQKERQSRAADSYLGIGNPLLLGNNGEDRRAFAVSGCATSSRFTTSSKAEPRSLTAFFRGASADIAAVARLAPLPETADELCAVAESLGGGTILLGAEATEGALKALSRTGGIARIRTLHFATHGLVTGELDGLAEPAIVLSPPEAGSEEDDGLLTASEIADLRLDADWVILSACNTAASEGENAEALSGLARAFFYAGSRSLLVSHWPGTSQAAVELPTSTFAALAGNPEMRRAEALRRAMNELIDKGGAAAHPLNWAPFVIAGNSF